MLRPAAGLLRPSGQVGTDACQKAHFSVGVPVKPSVLGMGAGLGVGTPQPCPQLQLAGGSPGS